MINLLLAEPIGQIIACNILASLDEKLIPPTTLKAFLQNCLKAFEEAPVHTTEELIGQFEDVARGDRPVTTGISKQFLISCSRRANITKNTSEFSTIMEVWTLTEHLISDSTVADGHASFLSNPDPTDPALKDSINKLNGRTDIYRADARLGGNPYRPLFWIAPTEMLSTKRKRNPLAEQGDSVRDLLGLIHYKSNVPLVEIRIPANQLHGIKHARPTFADAGSHRRFKVCPDGGSIKRRSSWGCTVDLRRLADGERIIDGVSERVVEPMDFDSKLNAKIEFVGITKNIMGISGDDDQAFLKCLPYSSDLSSLHDTLLGFLS